MPRFIPAFAVALAALTGSPLLRAAEQGGAASQAMGPGQLIQVLVALLAVLAVIVVLFGLVKKLNFVPGSANGVIKVVGALPLGAKERLLLVQVGDEQILISASPGSVNRIHRMARPVTPPETAPRRTGRKGFADILQAAAEGKRQ